MNEQKMMSNEANACWLSSPLSVAVNLIQNKDEFIAGVELDSTLPDSLVGLFIVACYAYV